MGLQTILDRYIFRELLSPFLISLGALCFVMLTKELLRLVELLVSKGVAFFSVLKVFAHLLPSFLVLTLPIAGIIASITAFGRLSFDKELVAMRAAGLSLVRLSHPVFLFALLVFGLTLTLSQWGQPWSNVNLKKVALNLLRDELILELERGVFNETVPKMVIYVPDTQSGQDLTGIFVSDDRNPDDPRVIVAQQYFVMTDPKSNQIALRLVDGVIHSRPDNVEEYSKVSFSTYDLKMNFNENLYNTDERSSVETILAKLDQSGWKDTAALRRLMEHYKDLAFPTASLVFCILGVPVGIVSKRSGRMGGFAVGVLVVVIYYVLNVACEFLVTTLIIPPFAGAWLPNALFLVATVIWFFNMNRH
ncbi:MAG TPA: LPS export ABC transporter permease LptF [Nitrospiraceae bacterium]|nr:LPS export ABC transporter permease LptF [Nitrospiraceae bacterium]